MKLGIGWERSEEGSNGRNWGWICPKQAFLMGRNDKIVFFERLTLDIYLLIKKKARQTRFRGLGILLFLIKM